MGSFTDFSNVLPNPSNSIAYDGSSESGNAGYAAGPGYASVKVSSKFRTSKDRTNTGRHIARSKAFQNYNVDIRYNNLTQEEFNTVYGFLLEKQGMLKTFFVPLPQYDNPQDSTLLTSSPPFSFTTNGSTSAGSTTITVQDAGYSSANDGTLRPGDMITFTDSSDSNHLKAYKITRVETNADYTGSVQPLITQQRLHISPPLQKTVSSGSTVNYENPKLKVIMKSDDVNYELKTNNLYSLSLSVEEVQ
jgi:hypothetical protein